MSETNDKDLGSSSSEEKVGFKIFKYLIQQYTVGGRENINMFVCAGPGFFQ